MTTEGDPNEQPEKRGRVQFSVCHALLVFVALGVMLALGTQFKHVGIAASGFLAVTVTGWWWKNPRLMLAGLTALAVFVITYIACWTQIGQAPLMHRGAYDVTRYRLFELNEALSQYTQQNGVYPDSLDDLTSAGYGGLYCDESGRPLDGWEHPFHYEKIADGFELTSFGRDGVVGGAGLDADVHSAEESLFRMERLPLWQFLFETATSHIVFRVAVLASFIAGFIWYAAQRDPQIGTSGRVIGAIVMTISAVLVAVLLAVIHVAVSQSGH